MRPGTESPRAMHPAFSASSSCMRFSTRSCSARRLSEVSIRVSIRSPTRGAAVRARPYLKLGVLVGAGPHDTRYLYLVGVSVAIHRHAGEIEEFHERGGALLL